MKSLIALITFYLCLSSQSTSAQRRTAPRRTTIPGQTYGTETFPTTPSTTLSLEDSTQSARPTFAFHVAKASSVVQPGMPVASLPMNVVQPGMPVASLPMNVIQPGMPVASLPGMPAGFPAMPSLPGGAVPFGAPLAPGILGIPGAVQLPVANPPSGGHFVFQKNPSPPKATTEKNDEDKSDQGGKNVMEKVDPTPIAKLCEEVETILPPGTTQEECFTGDPITLRYWQPYRALRNIKCKYNSNETDPTSHHTERCDAVAKGANCVQKYQQFVVLAAMGPAASGWACVRLGSGCSCSVRAKKRLRFTDYEQRTDLREFMRS